MNTVLQGILGDQVYAAFKKPKTDPTRYDGLANNRADFLRQALFKRATYYRHTSSFGKLNEGDVADAVTFYRSLLKGMCPANGFEPTSSTLYKNPISLPKIYCVCCGACSSSSIYAKARQHGEVPCPVCDKGYTSPAATIKYHLTRG